MGRLIRFLFGVALILVGVSYGLRFGEQAYYSLGGTPTSITFDHSACQAPQVLLFEAASRCTGAWTVAGTPGSGDVIGADATLANQTVTGRVVVDVAVLPLTGSNRLLGLLSPLLVLAGLGLALKRRRRRRHSYTSRRSVHDDYYSDGQHGGHDSYDDRDSHDYDGGGDSGGGDSGGGDSGSSD